MRKLKDPQVHGSEQVFEVFRELWNNVIFEDLQMIFQSWRD
jgi:hypothetical protein